MKKINYNNAVFVKSAASSSQFIQSGLPAVVFAGKSNVGKSSVINRLLNRKNFARVGSEPGKTIHVNYFRIDDRMFFVDLPGYGYAKVSDSVKERWAQLMEDFFASCGIALGVFIVDARHNPTADDRKMAEWFSSSGCSFTVIANKIDKLKKSELKDVESRIRSGLNISDDVPVILFSAEKGDGKEILLDMISSVSVSETQNR